MALIQEEWKYPAYRLILAGIPLFLAAVVISVLTHDCVHIIADKYFCSAAEGPARLEIYGEGHSVCGASSLAAALWTLILAFVSFAFYIRNPNNMFAGLLAFVNSSLRLPETLTVFWQLFSLKKEILSTDDSIALSLLNLKDPAPSVVILCFFSMITVFLAATVVHDTKKVPWKWLLALSLLALLYPLENILRDVLTNLSYQML